MKVMIIITVKYFLKNFNINNINLVHDNGIYVSEGIDVDKTIASKKCIICDYQYFLDKGFKFQWVACNGCHDTLMLSILKIHGVDYCCMINGISESDAINVLQNADLRKK